MTYFVRGVIINNAAAEGRATSLSVIARETPREAEAPLMDTPLSSPTTGWWVQPDPEQWAKTEPRPFILIGGFPGTIGSTVFSNTRVQEWVSGVLGWDEPEGPFGEPLAW